MRRRDFVKCTTAVPLAATIPFRPHRSTFAERAPLIRPVELRPDNLLLVARAAPATIAPGRKATVWTVAADDQAAVAPTIRVRTGETARIELENRLDEATILHWHGLHLPEAADGHPRLAIGTGERYRYDFPVINRAGTYWYHAHPHMRTGIQVYRGMAGLLLIGDEAEDALGLPTGAREIPLLIHDRRLGNDGTFSFDPVMHERMEGFLGDTPFGNGVPEPTVEVDSALHRLRVVNTTGARILRLGLSTGEPMTLIGVDGGLLAAPTRVESLDLGTGERVDLLVDFSGRAIGDRVMLRSLPFAAPGGMGMGRMMAGGLPQGAALDLLEFVVTRAVREPAWAPGGFPSIAPIAPASADRTREFRFQSAMMRHTINGRAFEMERIDEEVPFGSTEIWRFTNDGPFPHPVHMHEVQFQVLSREGGRARLFPWEAGWKDTVLVFPGETVSVIATFDHHRGRYLMHCHNLMHEDMGMMMNFAVV